ncbi:hypothetical protein JTM59_33645, partial [Pseudomonas aeruginosa]|nr:hypothetical protein [Pseudomonas aeruginosa]
RVVKSGLASNERQLNFTRDNYRLRICVAFFISGSRESSSTRFVVKSSLTGLTLFKHTASRSSIGGGNYG